MIPLYGFLEGDTLGLLVLAYEDETIAAVAQKIQASSRVRVPPRAKLKTFHNGRELFPSETVRDAGLAALERIDVRAE